MYLFEEDYRNTGHRKSFTPIFNDRLHVVNYK